ncbi:unnamed protein product, partial [Nesidiocoris tenuis]
MVSIAVVKAICRPEERRFLKGRSQLSPTPMRLRVTRSMGTAFYSPTTRRRSDRRRR